MTAEAGALATMPESSVAVPASRIGLREAAAVTLVVAMAAASRLAFLPTRGTWDADQGSEMLVLLALVSDHVVPLLGPQTSIGGFHHGVLYYWILAPSVLLFGPDPTAVVAELALLGSLTVVPIWWLAREIAGPLAGLAAAILYAVSATAIAGSTAIWNPGLAPLPAAIAVAAAWHAWRSERDRFWIVAAASLAVTMHAHVLGAVLVGPIVGLFIADARLRRRARRWRIVAACAVVMGASYLPLLAYDAGHGFVELRALSAFVAGGPGSAGPAGNPLVELVLVGLRVAAWPLTGLVTLGPVAPLPALLATALVIAGALVLVRSGSSGRHAVGRWLGATLAWSIAVLTIAAPALQTVVPGLPVDQYHAFMDPLVVVVAVAGLAALARAVAGAGRARLAPAVLLVPVAALVAWNVAHWPPAVAPDGGWPAAEAAASRLTASLEGTEGPVAIVSLPSFKPPDAYAFPLERQGVAVHDASAAGAVGDGPLVVVCDQLFHEAIGADCGGPAEGVRLGPSAARLDLIDRFEAAPGRWLSLYRAK